MRPVSSRLLGQKFTLPKRNPENRNEELRPNPKWCQSRSSAGGYDPLASGASALGPNSPELIRTVREPRATVAAFDGVRPSSVPVDAVTASGSGLDPTISPAYAYEQVNRVARARHLTPGRVERVVTDHLQACVLGFLGQENVNVVALNHALAELM
ncbi:potassium-transporting ATPase subunit C [Streptomyces sp. P9-2B-2]|uniref:potassium-transporting ATPase subunit C n=1 Tax=Streptomyces TaxID=1883 RepID=UPI00225AD0A2|nr:MULTISPECIES: potassium-transporting ATPase subunit C [Streptomyces]MCX4637761.1 potassium-transporting ATPase subunit C [Streptomyces platensis]WJY42694.1 potassium-transporting ATPase subunit C [Streptomyces sp. P9-2B-2]